jgi:hypothetical protein
MIDHEDVHRPGCYPGPARSQHDEHPADHFVSAIVTLQTSTAR